MHLRFAGCMPRRKKYPEGRTGDVINFYRFASIAQPEELGTALLSIAENHGLHGTVLIAPEGINCGFCGLPEALDAFVEEMLETSEFAFLKGAEIKRQRTNRDHYVFRRLRLKVKAEIITFGEPIDWNANQGRFLTPEEFHRLMQSGQVVPIDVRNDFESLVGSFKGAYRMPLEKFSDFREKYEILNKFKDKTLVTFCTGGIRCEKVVPFMRSKGYENVFQIEGGIINYLKKYPDGFWQGECFVFDDRFSIDSKEKQGRVKPCPKCGQPMFPESRLEQLEAETLENYELETLGTEDLICFQCNHREAVAESTESSSSRYSEEELRSLDERKLRL